MAIEFAIDELYATGWLALDTAGCEHAPDGRWCPTVDTVRAAFDEAGLALAVTHIQLFDCYRAEWRRPGGEPMGAVVGRSESEAAIYALSQLRRSLPAAAPA